MENSTEELIAKTIQEIGEELGMSHVKTRLYTVDSQGDPLDMSIELCYPPISGNKYIDTNFIWVNLANGRLSIGRECFDEGVIDRNCGEIPMGSPDMFDQIETNFKNCIRLIDAERAKKQN
jgi:hypothetical protein